MDGWSVGVVLDWTGFGFGFGFELGLALSTIGGKSSSKRVDGVDAFFREVAAGSMR